MFKINYRIVHSEYDDFIGQHGFFQIECNGYKYGEIYPKDLEAVMDKVPLYDWFERLVRVVKSLITKNYIALSDVESYNTWIEFYKKKENVAISVVKAEKMQGSQDIEFYLRDPIAGKWTDQIVSFRQLKREVVEKASKYIEIINISNTENIEIVNIKKNLEILQRV